MPEAAFMFPENEIPRTIAPSKLSKTMNYSAKQAGMLLHAYFSQY
ncbi:hypothetical protein P8H26_12585 [Pseudochrobactrum sp. sp1633]|nr:hypothetical protein [Pseudochrobactrum sp. sp1633]MDM8346227.1 hypothetical protein [Pseudochrobactrum sp. sp1633]HWD13706.1 hypothetical protein [Pseudochrobactrum sp.]